jgi:hypothetical protein
MICTYQVKTGNAEISDKMTRMAQTRLEGEKLASNLKKGQKAGYNI